MCARSHTPVYLQQAEETCTLSGAVCCISTISSLSCVFSLYKQAIRNTSPRWWRTELGSSFLETDAVVWGVQPYAVACCLSEVADITLNTRRLPAADVFIVSGSLVFRLQSLFFISPFIHFKVVILMKLLHRHTASYHQHQASEFFRQDALVVKAVDFSSQIQLYLGFKSDRRAAGVDEYTLSSV